MNKLGPDVERMLSLQLSEKQEADFLHYAEEILEWNKRSNLTSIRTLEGIRSRHFLDSLSCWIAMRAGGDKVIDVGSGAGLPGLALKIIHNPMQLTLLESAGKKTKFIQHSVQVLGLDGVRVEQARVEDFGQLPEEREKYDWAIARAVAPLPVLAEYLLPLVRVGGYMLAQKSRKAKEEARAAKNAVRMLGGGGIDVREVQVPGLDAERYLLVIKKILPTPAKYPRRVGVASKNSL